MVFMISSRGQEVGKGQYFSYSYTLVHAWLWTTAWLSEKSIIDSYSSCCLYEYLAIP